MVSMHFGATTPVPLSQAYYKGIEIHTGRVQSSATLAGPLDCMACGKLHARAITTRLAKFADAPEAMTDPGTKIVFLR
jgi:alcohol dehydrogenase